MSGGIVTSGETSSGLSVGEGDLLEVRSGGTIVNTTIDADGTVEVEPGGVAISSLILDGGDQEVEIGGSASLTMISSGGFDTVEGTAISATVSGGGEQDTGLGGVASGTTVLSGAFQGVGDDEVLGGATAQAGGSAVATVLSGGEQDVDGGSTATSTTILSGGYQVVGDDSNRIVLSGDASIGAIVSSGGVEAVLGLSGQSGTFTYGFDGQVYQTVTVSGGTQVISYGDALDDDIVTLVQSGGEVYRTARTPDGTLVGEVHSQTGQINIAGVVSDTTVLSGGTFIFAGGSAVGLVVSSGGIEIVGGTISGSDSVSITPSLVQVFSNHVSSGVLVIVSSGGQDVSGVIQVGAEEDVYSGGVTSGTQIFYDATQTLFGGSAVATTVSSGGSQILSGGTAVDTLLSGATQTVSSGAVVSGSMLTASSLLTLSSGASAISATVSGSFMQVQSGGSAQDTIVISSPLAGGVTGRVEGLAVSSGGTVTGTQLLAGSFESLYGTAISEVISGGPGQNGTAQEILNDEGAIASGTKVIGPTSILQVDAGTAIDTILSAGGILQNSYVASGTHVLSGGVDINILFSYNAVISSGGSLIAGTRSNNDLPATVETTSVFLGGMQTITSGAIASSTLIASGGAQLVSSGGLAVSSLVNNGGTETVSSGGSATLASVQGSEIVSAGGSAASIMVSSGGTLTVFSGGLASGAVIGDGGSAVISASGSAVLDTISSGGVELVYGTAVSATVLSGGQETVLSGGVASGTLVLGGGSDSISAGGTAIAATIETGGSETVLSRGVANATTVNLAASQTVSAGGLASGASVTGGTQTVLAGGAVTATTVSTDGVVLVSGGASSLVAEGDGTIKVANGGVTSQTRVNAGGLEIVLAGGSAVSTTVNSGGAEGVFAGGTAVDTTIGIGGLERVASGGVSINPVVLGTLIDENGDPTTGAIIKSGGVQVVAADAEVSDTTVESGGVLIELPGADPTGTIVQSGGAVISGGLVLQQPGSATQTASVISGIVLGNGASVFVLSAGTAEVTTIDTGATEYVYAGGVTSGTIINGGTLDLADGTLATGGLAFGSAGGTLQIDDTTPLSTTVSGFTAGHSIDLTALGYSPGGSATLGPGDVLAITEGGATDTIQLTGDYTGATFAISPGRVSDNQVTTTTITTDLPNSGTATDAYTIAGAQSAQPTDDAAALSPFTSVTIANAAAPSGAATVTLSAANGTLSNLGGGTLSNNGLTYTVIGTPAALQAALRGLVFTPTDHEVAPGSTATTQFQLTVSDGAAISSNGATSVVATALETAPTISGGASGQAITDQQAIQAFSGFTIADPDAGAVETTFITLSQNGVASDGGGTLSGAGLSHTGAGTYALASGDPADEQAALQALVFAPTAGIAGVGSTLTTTAALTVSDGTLSAQSATTIVVTQAAATGTAVGDVHMVTLRGVHYDFQAVGDFTLIRAASPADPFDVQIRTAAFGTAVSVTVQAAAQLGPDAVDFALDGTVAINGVTDTALDAAHPTQTLAGGTLTSLGNGDYSLDWTTGEQISVTNHGVNMDLQTQLPSNAQPGAVQGLLGDLAASGSDLALANGTPLTQLDATSLGQLAQAWTVGPSSLLDGGTVALHPAMLVAATPSFIMDDAPGAVLTGSLGRAAGSPSTVIAGTLANLFGSVISNFASSDRIDVIGAAPGSPIDYTTNAGGGTLTIGGTALTILGLAPKAHASTASDGAGGMLLRFT